MKSKMTALLIAALVGLVSVGAFAQSIRQPKEKPSEVLLPAPKAEVRSVFVIYGKKPKAEIQVGDQVRTVTVGELIDGWTIASIDERGVIVSQVRSRMVHREAAKNDLWFMPKSSGPSMESFTIEITLPGAKI